MRYLIVNADDFGQSAGINEGIIECFEHGIVTSTSLMVRWPAARDAAAYARTHPELSLGIHLDLGEWRSVGEGWEPIYEVVPGEEESKVREEVERQLAIFEQLVGDLPSHIDTHQHVHLREPFGTVVGGIAADLHLPLRHKSTGIHYCGDFYGMSWDGREVLDDIGVDGLLRILHRLESPVTELACHPGKVGTLDTMYRAGREVEIRTLTDPGLKEALDGMAIRLCSFLTLPRDLQTTGRLIDK